jgi:alpha-amylase/alpha-mannosidase (GH57 family)
MDRIMANKDKQDKFLTIHGHFYQPPRENPWLEAIELQDSALPFHDWNERICKECYNPNSVSRIVDNRNRILDIVNNYSYMSFNFGPTLLSWLEEFAPLTYERIIKADIDSVSEHDGHGNAMAQVYNHIIMPLANLHDKETQVIWGIKDFEYRFGRKPEGIWLAETAVDDETLKVLVDNGIKFTVLSPYQALKMKKISSREWQDVSWGNIDPARSYKYTIKSDPTKSIDLFFYDGAISRSVAFDELLTDGNKFIKRLKDGVSELRDYPQLVNIATDGESYGHHTKFGDMALSYVLKIKAEDEGFKITNYAEYLDKYRSDYEVDIKQASSWSCFHGVGRWKEDCGCSTGGHPGWNQKWREPLRNALDYLRDELAKVFETEGQKYFNKDVWEVRNCYIDVILDRNFSKIKKFKKEHFNQDLTEEEEVKGLELLEIQRQTMLMYTSCGWFFSEISGIETVQIMKYAARAMQLAGRFSDINYEEKFLEILSQAKSNIAEFGTGKDIYERFVKPSVVTQKQLACLWAISSLYQDFEDEEDVYCYTIKRFDYQKAQKGNSKFIVGHIEIRSKVTMAKSNLMFALIQYAGGDFHCAIKQFSTNEEYQQLKASLLKTFMLSPITEIIRGLDETFGKEYFTLKDIFIEERKKILQILLKDQMKKFATTYKDMYEQGKSSIYHMQNLGLEIPNEFKISAGYALSKRYNDLLANSDGFVENSIIQQITDINYEAKKMNITIDKEPSNKHFAKRIIINLNRLTKSFEIQQANSVIELFDIISKLDLQIDISEPQNIYYNKIYHRIGDILEKNPKEKDIKFINNLLEIGRCLNINVDFYKVKIDKLVNND